MPKPADQMQPLSDKSILELQALASAAQAPAHRPRYRLSRSAQLHLIDQLSRWGGAGLAIFAGVAIFIAIVPARDMPFRMAVWAAMVFGSLYLCRRYRKDFRRGDRIASHPFRWRAYYAATLSVVSAAFGAGAWLIVKTGADPASSMEVFAIMALAALGSAAFHSTHRASAAAAGLPAFVAIYAAALSVFGVAAYTVSLFAAGVLSALALGYAVVKAERQAASRFPRTTFNRRESERPAVAKPKQTARKAG